MSGYDLNENTYHDCFHVDCILFVPSNFIEENHDLINSL
jgi:hypothetical protein